MVGRVIFKNFETGSYEYMRVTMYEGTSYADMERATEFSSCLVSLAKRSYDYDYISSKDAPRMSIAQLQGLCTRASQFLKKNTHVTMVDFCMRGDEILMRKSSCKSGLYEPVDFSALLACKRDNLYKLCASLGEEIYLCRSVLRSVLNYCMHRFYNTDEEIFGLSGKGLYINAALFIHDKRSMKLLDVSWNMRRLIVSKRKRRFCPHLVRTFSFSSAIETQRSHAPHARLVSLWRTLREDAFSELSFRLSESKHRGVDFALESCENEKIRRLAREFTDELKDYVSNYEFCFAAPSHIEYLDVEDALALCIDIELADKIAENAAVRSANMKLMEKIPCPDYYDSQGRAYNL